MASTITKLLLLAGIAIAVLPEPVPAIELTCRGCRDNCCSEVHVGRQSCADDCAMRYARCLDANCIRCVQSRYKRPWLHSFAPGLPGEGYQRRLPPEYGISGTKPVQLYRGQEIAVERDRKVSHRDQRSAATRERAQTRSTGGR